jgi:hypothetical protein
VELDGSGTGLAPATGAEFPDPDPRDELPSRRTLGDRIVRYSTLKAAQRRFTEFLANEGSKEAAAAAVKLAECGTLLTFRDYFTIEQVKLTRASFCKKHTLCQLCAVRRSAKFLEQTLPKLELIRRESSEPLYAHFIVLTVKNGPDLSERLRHLEAAWQRLNGRKRNRRDYPDTLLRHVVAGLTALEVTNKGNGWHPHLNVLVLSTRKSFDWQACKDEWREVTGDSHVVHFSQDCANLEATLAETIKYVTKFSDLEPAQLWELHRALQGRRTVRGFGKLWGLKAPQKLTDDVLSADLPYIEYVCRYLGPAGYTILSALSCAAGARPAPPAVCPPGYRRRIVGTI